MVNSNINPEIDKQAQTFLEVMPGPKGHLVVIHAKYLRSCKVTDPEKTCYANIYIAYRSSGKVIKITPIKHFLAEAVKHELFQEDFTEYLADLLNSAIQPEGVAVIMTVNHFHDDIATSIASRGSFTNPENLNLVLQVLRLPDPPRP